MGGKQSPSCFSFYLSWHVVTPTSIFNSLNVPPRKRKGCLLSSIKKYFGAAKAHNRSPCCAHYWLWLAAVWRHVCEMLSVCVWFYKTMSVFMCMGLYICSLWWKAILHLYACMTCTQAHTQYHYLIEAPWSFVQYMYAWPSLNNTIKYIQNVYIMYISLLCISFFVYDFFAMYS